MLPVYKGGDEAAGGRGRGRGLLLFENQPCVNCGSGPCGRNGHRE